MSKFALINMPLFSSYRPSIQLGRLKAQLVANGIGAKCFFPNIEFAQLVGGELYNHLSDQCDILLGHWLFSKALPELAITGTEDAFLERYKDNLFDAKLGADWAECKRTLTSMRNETIPKFVSDYCHSVDWTEYDFVGFTCTFSQLVASLALAKQIKLIHKSVKIVLGGAEVQSSMGEEVFKQCEFVNYIVQGEGEKSVLTLQNQKNSRAIVYCDEPIHLGELPFPDYDDFFEVIDNVGDRSIAANATLIPIEGSRGCWWGQKHHCTFCGLNGPDLRFRTRTAESILEEVATQSNRHDRYDFEFVDNILDYKHFETLLPALSESNSDYNFFAETKANLKKENLKLLKEAGFNVIQPGIESFSSQVLKIMKKGVTSAQNLELLKWGAELGVRVIWNVLYGFPGETEGDYLAMISLLKKLTHLEPPQASGAIRVDRFSPYFNSIKDGNSLYFDNVKPAAPYELIYPASWSHSNLAYFFTGKAKNSVQKGTYDELQRVVSRWKAAWDSPSKPSLELKKGIYHGHVIDKRSDQHEVYKLEGLAYEIAKALDQNSATRSFLREQMGKISETDEVIDELLDLDLCVELDNRLIFLPVSK